MMSRLTRKPSSLQKDKIESFIEGAEHRQTEARLPSKGLPWEAPEVREDVAKVYNLRLPEPYLLKLKYIAEHTPHSMQSFCMDVLLPAIDKEIEELAADRDDHR
ncbi:hypothetical protein Nhal_4002 (plasmid) [Nitrosococcus halophilus Nc 4]|uniref:Uncharacterized protein n=1 Tax=Nitrosococcus halophilus (strain Nc4) TaxID=472759 RepID=D5C5F6_NITHN|nr:hypothetical protein [Nitrosococcus halophilus]ADE17010.1 hypothetical protein Nhal_4002 [Nitrosococcus halophilus Nc 4]